MSNYEDYLARNNRSRLGFGTRSDGEVHPVKALAIFGGISLGVPFLASIISAVTGAIFHWFFG